MTTHAKFGTWKSPIVADLITQQTIGIAEVRVDEVTQTIYHAESRPSEGGRIVVVNTATGEDVFGKDWNARTGVHEYGGAAFAVRAGVLYFTDFASRRVYIVKDGTPEPVSPNNSNFRFGDFEIHPRKSHLIVSVLEDHTKPAPADVVNKLVILNTETQKITTIASGADFYSTPKFSPSGDKLSWIQWYHPDMPWEGSELYVATFDSDTPDAVNPKRIAGKPAEVSINQAKWVSNDVLVYLNDVDGFYNPYTYSVSADKSTAILPNPVEEDYADPAWLLGASRWAVLDVETLLVTPTHNGVVYIALLDLATGKLTKVDSSYVTVDAVQAVSRTKAVFVGKTDNLPPALITLDLLTLNSAAGAKFNSLKATSKVGETLPEGIFPTHQAIQLSDKDGGPLHVLYFPPTNPAYAGGEGNELPPCVLNMHGGPTSRVTPGMSWTTSYFTSRGYAWVDVNYGGSSGYGKKYRDRLRSNWGIVDVEDSVSAIDQLGERGLIDRKRVAIRGGSAGGYSTLAGLVTKPTAYATGTSSYGISDLAMLAGDTHKFESRYLERLIGGTIEQVPQVYKDRSPVNHADQIAVPLLILQGADDAVVPPSQAEAIVKQVKERGGKIDCIIFKGEGHGWRKAETIKEALEKELAWYTEVYGL